MANEPDFFVKESIFVPLQRYAGLGQRGKYLFHVDDVFPNSVCVNHNIIDVG